MATYYTWVFQTHILVWHIGDNFGLNCALLEESMKLCPRGYLGVLIADIAGPTTSLQRFPFKNGKFKMAAIKYVFVHYLNLNEYICRFVWSRCIFLCFWNPMDILWNTSNKWQSNAPSQKVKLYNGRHTTCVWYIYIVKSKCSDCNVLIFKSTPVFWVLGNTMNNLKYVATPYSQCFLCTVDTGWGFQTM